MEISLQKKIEKFNKIVKIPGDKSCSIRALLLASQCIGISKIKNLLLSQDVLTTIRALRTLGVKITKSNNGKIYNVYGNGINSFRTDKKIKIWLGNSGTLARLLMGCLATHGGGKYYLYGDSSLNSRDMSRVTAGLEKVGAFVYYSKGKKTLPLTIEGTTMPLAQDHIHTLGSSQVKSSLLLSFLGCHGRSNLLELKPSRTHTEIILKKIAPNVIKIKKLRKGNLISVDGLKNLYALPKFYSIGNDPSSSAFLILLTLLTPRSRLTLPGIICNPTRIGFIQILKKMNANIKIVKKKKDPNSGEVLGTIIVTGGRKLKPISVSKNIASLIDELPLLFWASSWASGTSKYHNCGELVKKESNRLLEVKKILTQAGVRCKTTKDSMTIYGKEKIESQNKSILVNCHHDHRINALACIVALSSGIKTKIKNFDTSTSFPSFISLIRNLGGKIEIRKN